LGAADSCGAETWLPPVGLPLLSSGAPCGLWGCKNRGHSISWLGVIEGVPNQGVVCYVNYGRFFHLFVMFWVYVTFCFVCLVCWYQHNCLQRLVSEMTCYVLSVMLNPTHSLTTSVWLKQLHENLFCLISLLSVLSSKQWNKWSSFAAWVTNSEAIALVPGHQISWVFCIV